MDSFDGESRDNNGSYHGSQQVDAEGFGEDYGDGYDANAGFDENGNTDDFAGGFTGTCFNCGEEGHSKADCPNERVFTGTCYNCGQEGHSKADCPSERVFTGTCFKCGQGGHSKADCPNERVFNGSCYICGQEGHSKQDCPTKGPDLCRNCDEEGHASHECKNKRKLNLEGVEDLDPTIAWSNMKVAVAPGEDRDISDFRHGLASFCKSQPDTTYLEIEQLLRADDMPIYLIAMEKEPQDMVTLIDLQGNIDREFQVGFYFQPVAPKKSMRNRWPKNAEVNIERLANAGLPYDRRAMKCHKCEEVGHVAKNCTQESVSTHERIEIKCLNCNEVGHRIRDCPEERVKKNRGCRNCGSEEHKAADCTEERSATDVECRRCKEIGHFAKDCPKYADMPDGCRNCESPDHKSRDCPLPRDYSKVKCNRCQQMGHTVVRCTLPDPELQETQETQETQERSDTPAPFAEDGAWN